MPNFAQNSVVISSMATKKYIWAYFRRKSMDLGPKKHTSQNEVLRSTPDILVFDPTSLSHKTRWSYNHHFDWYFGRVCMKSWFEIGLLDPAQHVTGIQQFSEIMTRSSTLSPSYELPPETNHSQLSTFPRPCLVCSWGKLKACNAVCSVQWFLACFCNNLVWGTFICLQMLGWLRSYHVLSLPEGSENYPHRQNRRS